MKETTLWTHVKPGLQNLGTFQKISDRFTPGVPDVLGCMGGRGVAMELKELKGVAIRKVSFRPRQLDWLEDWAASGGAAFILSSYGHTVYLHDHSLGAEMEEGMTPERLEASALLIFTKKKSWGEFSVALWKFLRDWD